MKESLQQVFHADKPILATLHLYGFTPDQVHELAKREMDQLYTNGVDAILVEDYFGSPEDVEWAHRRPMRIAYAQDAVVEHSHNYSLAELKRRFYGEGYADGAIFGDAPSLLRELAAGVKEILRDVVFLLKHPAGLKELPMAPVRRVVCADRLRVRPSASRLQHERA